MYLCILHFCAHCTFLPICFFSKGIIFGSNFLHTIVRKSLKNNINCKKQWTNSKLTHCEVRRNFRFLHICHKEKCEINLYVGKFRVCPRINFRDLTPSKYYKTRVPDPNNRCPRQRLPVKDHKRVLLNFVGGGGGGCKMYRKVPKFDISSHDRYFLHGHHP